MKRRNWLLAALVGMPLAVAGVVFANSDARSNTCPLTGEQLPCPNCCPLNQTEHRGYTCPVTGEELPCEKCCPINGGK